MKKMRPAGLSSDDELDECEGTYFSVSKPLTRGKENPLEGVALPEVEERTDNSEVQGQSDVFHKAAEQNDINVLATLLKSGVSADESRPNEWTPLMKACARGNHEAAELLLQNGANPNAVKEMFTPLMACCVCSYVQEEGRLLCLKKLIKFGANVNAHDRFATTALMTASASGLDSIVAELLAVPDIDVNAQDREGWNALFFAVANNYKSIAARLVSAGINLEAVSDKNVTVLQVASTKGYKEILELLAPKKFEKSEGLTVRELSEPLIEFFNEMPNEDGEGGFYSDVRDLFTGLGLEKLYEKCCIKVSMHDFLLKGENLEELGIKLEPLKWKIMTQGIHRYHIYPWKKSSLYKLECETEPTFEDVINCLANVTKHLSVMCATLKYLKMRIPKRIKGSNSIDKEVVTTLVNSYVELDTIKKNLREIIGIAKKIRPIGIREVDFIGSCKQVPKSSGYYILAAGTIAAFLIYKLR